MTLDHAKELRESNAAWDAEVAELIDWFVASSYWSGPESVEQVFVLSQPDDEESLVLARSIKNDSVDRNGNPCPFTYGQARYTRTDIRRGNPATTSELVAS